MTQRETYLNNYEVLSSAAVGVVMTRTREPHRAAEAIKEWAFHSKRIVKTWNVVTGWTEHEASEEDAAPDRKVDMYSALKLIDDVDGDGTNKWENTVCIVQYPHWVLPKHGPTIQLLKEYSRKFTETRQRIILMCPEETSLPRELENDITILDFHLPSREELRSVYRMVMSSVARRSGCASVEGVFNPEEVELLLSSGGGMTESEFETALAKGIITYRSKWPNVSAKEMNSVLMDSKTEVIKRSEVLELMKSVPLEDVGGLEVLKEWMMMRKPCFSDEAAAYGVPTPKGIAAIGPPGTGKTLMAKAIAGILGMPLIRFDVGKVFGSLVGQSEERVRASLKQLDACAPCVVLIDEVDKAGLNPRQGGGDSGTSMRVLGAILTHMQETKAEVFWVFTANRADGLDPALVRKGRMDEVFAVLPPNSIERKAVLNIHLRKMKQDPTKINDLNIAVEVSDGFVSAEIEAAVKEAVTKSFSTKEKVTGELIAQQLRMMKPISEAFADDFNAMKQWAQQNARVASLPEPTGELRSRSRSRVRRIETQTNGSDE